MNNVLLDFIHIDTWFPKTMNYKKIPKYQQALKVLTSILHHLFFDFYQDVFLPESNPGPTPFVTHSTVYSFLEKRLLPR
jgi:hypothetical protein